MNTIVIISEDENEEMLDIIEEINALKVLAQTLAADDELYFGNSELYKQIKVDLKNSMAVYRDRWQQIITRYQLDPEKADSYMLNFGDRSIQYVDG